VDPVELLITYIESLEGFQLQGAHEPYDHMGATLTNAVLQAGISYNYVVLPRVTRLRSRPDARTTSGFLALLRHHGPEILLDWRGKRKPATLLALAELLTRHGIETESQLRRWLQDRRNDQEIRRVRGIGPKTLDYHCGIGKASSEWCVPGTGGLIEHKRPAELATRHGGDVDAERLATCRVAAAPRTRPPPDESFWVLPDLGVLVDQFRRRLCGGGTPSQE